MILNYGGVKAHCGGKISSLIPDHSLSLVHLTRKLINENLIRDDKFFIRKLKQ